MCLVFTLLLASILVMLFHLSLTPLLVAQLLLSRAYWKRRTSRARRLSYTTPASSLELMMLELGPFQKWSDHTVLGTVFANHRCFDLRIQSTRHLRCFFNHWTFWCVIVETGEACRDLDGRVRVSETDSVCVWIIDDVSILYSVVICQSTRNHHLGACIQYVVKHAGLIWHLYDV